jgi:hypothetical protein
MGILKNIFVLTLMYSVLFPQSFNTYLMGYMQGNYQYPPNAPNYVGDEFGKRLAAGDINGDGYDDLAVFSFYTSTGLLSGEVDVFFGSSPFDTIPDITLKGEYDLQLFGSGIFMNGDYNSDGVNDLVIGVVGQNDDRGLVKIFFGGSPFDTTADLIFQENGNINAYFGSDLASVDFNSDGYDDLLVGAPNDRDVFLYFGGADMDTVADGVFHRLFWSLNTAGDFNNDGYEDFITSGNNWSHLYYGGDTVNTDVNLIFHASGDIEANDYNGDSFVDLYFSLTGIFLGGEIPDTTLDITAPVEFRGNPAAGKYNMDGFSDLILGQSGNGCGVVYLHLGNNPMNNIPDGYFYDTGCGKLGYRTAAGDFNGDGADDMAFSERWYQNYFEFWPDYKIGRVYVFSGDTTSLSVSEDVPTLSQDFRLFDPYPNPFNAVVTIPFELDNNSYVIARLFDIKGRLVDVFINEEKTAGFYEFTYQANTIPTGVYFIRFTTNTGSDVKKIILLK